MSTNRTIRNTFTGDHVLEYDQKSKRANWLDPNIVFGLAYPYVKPGQTILDVGIGTGLSSVLFHKAGLQVLGMDFSSEMLAMCRSKGFAKELIEHDVSVAPYPLGDKTVDHAVCTGVMHIFDDLNVIFSEVCRVMRVGGFFTFVVADPRAQGVKEQSMGGCKAHKGKANFYNHSEPSMVELYDRCGFELINSLRFVSSAIGKREMSYRACVVQKL